MRKLACLLTAIALSACATAKAPVDRTKIGSVHVLVGDASALQQMRAADDSDADVDSSAPPKRVYWYLAGR